MHDCALGMETEWLASGFKRSSGKAAEQATSSLQCTCGRLYGCCSGLQSMGSRIQKPTLPELRGLRLASHFKARRNAVCLPSLLLGYSKPASYNFFAELLCARRSTREYTSSFIIPWRIR